MAPRRHSALRRLAAAVLAMGLLAAPAAAADDGWAPKMNRDLMSPYCPGRALSDCPSPQAAELRAWIAEQERQGRARQEVEAQLERLYGEIIRSAPRAQGWGLTAYLVPVGAMLAGIALVVVFLRRQRRSAGVGAVDAAPPVPVDPELERIVDDELGSARS